MAPSIATPRWRLVMPAGIEATPRFVAEPRGAEDSQRLAEQASGDPSGGHVPRGATARADSSSSEEEGGPPERDRGVGQGEGGHDEEGRERGEERDQALVEEVAAGGLDFRPVRSAAEGVLQVRIVGGGCGGGDGGCWGGDGGCGGGGGGGAAAAAAAISTSSASSLSSSSSLARSSTPPVTAALVDMQKATTTPAMSAHRRRGGGTTRARRRPARRPAGSCSGGGRGG